VKRLLFVLAVISIASIAAHAGVLSGGAVSGGTFGDGEPVGAGGGAGACTDGVNCLCDTISPASSLIFCEDWENAGYYENVSNGPISSSDGLDRGNLSEWFSIHSYTGAGLSVWADGVPTLGSRCNYGPGSPGGLSGCGLTKEYCSTAQGTLAGVGADCWGPNVNTGSCLDIQRASDFDAEIGTLTLSGGTGSASDVGAGNTHMAYRVAGGIGNTCGFLGARNFGSNYTEVGITMALAYSSNAETSGIFGVPAGQTEPWKHDEWADSSETYAEHWNLGRTGAGSDSVLPYKPFMWTTDCASAIASVTVHVGATPACNDGNLSARFGASSSVYDQATDFPWGTWGCHQAHISGLGTTNVTIKFWHDGVLIMHVSGIDGTYLRNQNYRVVKPNAYANANQVGQGDVPTTETAYRYQDNIVVVNGPPESCASIGF